MLLGEELNAFGWLKVRAEFNSMEARKTLGNLCICLSISSSPDLWLLRVEGKRRIGNLGIVDANYYI